MKSDPRPREIWTPAQAKVLRDNPRADPSELRILLAKIGSDRTDSAIKNKLATLRMPVRRTATETQRALQSGWPMLPPEERRDDTYRRRLLEEDLKMVRARQQVAA